MAARLLLPLAFLTAQVSCGQNSLTFVIDDTSSMQTVISQVRNAAKSIVDIVLHEKASQIEDIVLVTFNDPGYRFRKQTRDESELKEALDSIHVHGGGDCPEMALAGIKEGLARSRPGSYLYVFTDASASDYRKFAEIKKLCQEKQSQIVFILTGKCSDTGRETNQVYHDIAEASDGQVYVIEKHEVEQVIETIKETITGDRTMVASTTAPAHKWKSVEFTIDEQIEYAIVSAAAGSKVDLKVYDSKYHEIAGTHITWTKHVKVMKITNLVRGTYKAKVRGKSQVKIMVFGRTDFNFQHGFSTTVQTNLEATDTQPTTGVDTHLMVSVQAEKHSAQIQEVELLNTHNQIIMKLPLTHVQGDIYKTDKFKSPGQTFIIAVVAKSKTGNTIRRIAKTPVTPIESVAPVISKTINIMRVEGGASVDVECRIVEGKPRPEILWYVKKQGATTFTSLQGTDVVYHVTRASTDDQYKCVAKNVRAEDEHIVTLNVRTRPKFQNAPDFIKKNEGEPTSIECTLQEGNPHPKVTWQFKPQGTTDFKLLDNEGELLTISATQLNQAGNYKCLATNTVGSDEKTTILEVIAKPTIEKLSPKRVALENTPVTLHCRVIRGIPKPTVTWFYKGTNSAAYKMISKDSEKLFLRNIQLTDAGKYRCVAENKVAKTEQVVELEVHALPKFQTTPVIIIKNEGDPASIQCKIIRGFPKPTVTWFYKGSQSAEYKMISKNSEELILTNIQLTDAGQYKCVAENKVAKTEQVVQLEVHALPKFQTTTAIITKNEGDPASIQCKLEKGNPRPKVSWQFKLKDTTGFNNLEHDGETLFIAETQLSQAGEYKCSAKNVVGSDEKTTTLVVNVKPTTEKLLSKRTVMENTTESLQCRVTRGFPKPTVTWFYKGQQSADYKMISKNSEELILTNIQLTDAGQYKCVAENKVAKTEQVVQLEVHALPKFQTTTAIITKNEGDPASIQCKLEKSNPRPKVSWQFKLKDTTGFNNLEHDGETLFITETQLSQAGEYKCSAKNVVGSDEKTTTLVVNVKPTTEELSSKRTVMENTTESLQCRVTRGFPKPTVTWFYKGQQSADYKMISKNSEELILTNIQLTDAGQYKCVAENKVAKTEQIVELEVHALPKFQTSPVIITKNEGDPASIQCKLQKGYPRPKVSWQFKPKDMTGFNNLEHDGETFFIAATQLSQAGEYKCSAKNVVGSDEKTTTIVVNVKPTTEKLLSKRTVMENTTESLQCRVTRGFPKPTVTWFYKGQQSADYKMISKNSEELILTNIQLTDAGQYKCVAENKVAKTEQVVQLEVHALPKFQTTTAIITKNEGDPASIQCKLEKGNPRPKVSWQFKPKDTTGFNNLEHDGETLFIAATQLSQAGEYKCSAKNVVGSDEKTTILAVNVKPTTEELPPKRTVMENTTESLQCRVIRGFPKPTVTWFYKGPQSAEYKMITKNSEELILRNIQLTEAGHYKCVAENKVAKTEQVVQLEVHALPKFQTTTAIITKNEGDPASIQCKLEKGNPRPKVSWQFKPKDTTGFNNLEHDGETLFIAATQLSQAGEYKCAAKNVVGSDEKTTTLVVNVKPTTEELPPKRTVMENTTESLQCRVTRGFPKPTVTWFYKGPQSADYKTISKNSEELILRNIQLTDAGQYKCVAENKVAKTEQVVQLEVHAPPKFQNTADIITKNEGDPAMIECKLQKGNPHPKVTWQFKHRDTTEFKYLEHEGELLAIAAPQLNQAGTYKCLATNVEGIDEKTTTLVVRAKPAIEGLTPKLSALENTTASVPCRAKGFPKPTVNWFYKGSHSAEYETVSKNKEIIILEHLQLSDAGRYKCVAENEVGKTEQVVELLVNAPPRIVFVPPNTPEYSGVEGDVAMRLPCAAVGYPIPTITWKVDNHVIPSDKSKELYVENNTLFLRNPKEIHSSSKSHTYICHAKNDFGEAAQSYKVYISQCEYSNNVTDIQYGYLEKPFDFTCPLPYTDPKSVRWYQNCTDYTTGPSLHFNHPTDTDSGNYTCRVSDLTGAASHTVELVFGRPPTRDGISFDLSWSGESKTIACYSYEQPVGKYDWFYNGEKIDTHSQSLQVIGWGQYTCKITHPLGNLALDFHVTTKNKECGIPTSFLKTEYAPLILDSSLEWPVLKTSGHYFIMPHSEKLQLICQDEKSLNKSVELSNSFAKFPELKSVYATCEKEDSFLVGGIYQKISEMKCKNSVTYSVLKTGKPCLGDNTELMRVGFYVNGFTDVYQSCVDSIRKIPLYTKINTIAVKREASGTVTAVKGACVDECCHEKTQLVNAFDVSFGPAEKATFSDMLNSVNYCKPKNNSYTTWHDIEETSRGRAETDQLTVWSGAAKYSKVDGVWTPKYLWKVMESWGTSEKMVVIHENAETGGPKLCDGSCESEGVLWLEAAGNRTYCCNLNDFKKAFGVAIDFRWRVYINKWSCGIRQELVPAMCQICAKIGAMCSLNSRDILEIKDARGSDVRSAGTFSVLANGRLLKVESTA